LFRQEDHTPRRFPRRVWSLTLPTPRANQAERPNKHDAGSSLPAASRCPPRCGAHAEIYPLSSRESSLRRRGAGIQSGKDGHPVGHLASPYGSQRHNILAPNARSLRGSLFSVIRAPTSRGRIGALRLAITDLTSCIGERDARHGAVLLGECALGAGPVSLPADRWP
jgi:hypothetical protein